jgi:hypothetical protein
MTYSTSDPAYVMAKQSQLLIFLQNLEGVANTASLQSAYGTACDPGRTSRRDLRPSGLNTFDRTSDGLLSVFPDAAGAEPRQGAKREASRAEQGVSGCAATEGGDQTTGGQRYRALKHSLAKLLHPDTRSGPDASHSDSERTRLFKEIWSEIELIERQSERRA